MFGSLDTDRVLSIVRSGSLGLGFSSAGVVSAILGSELRRVMALGHLVVSLAGGDLEGGGLGDIV